MKRLLQVVIVLIPIGIGLTTSLALSLFYAGESIPVAYLHVDVASTLLLAGIGTALLILAGRSIRLLLDRTHERGAALGAARTQAQAIRDRHRFLQRLDHELKNPLTAIRVGLANLDNGSDVAAQHEALNSVNAQVHRISRLTADLRKLAELDNRPIERSPINMAGLLRQVYELAQERLEAETRHLSLILPQAPWPLPGISGDRDLLLLVIHNLIDNALKFTRPGDTIEIRAFEDSAAVVVEVADTGPGISTEDLPHVWEELYRGQSARGVQGSGLGLALTHTIIQRHDGQITLRSRPGQGTVFTVRLPLKI